MAEKRAAFIAVAKLPLALLQTLSRPRGEHEIPLSQHRGMGFRSTTGEMGPSWSTN